MEKYQKRLSAKLRRYKELKGCEYCGWNKHGIALDFAHIDPSNKSYEITKSGPCGSGMGKMVSRVTTGKDKVKNRQRWKELKEEIRKCRVLCKNCHVVETYNNKEMHNSHNTYKERQGIEPTIVASLEAFM